jgi:hypothetical protein
MSKIQKSNTVDSDGWATQETLVREFVRPTHVPDAVHETIADAIEAWPQLSEAPPLAAFVDVEKLDGLVTQRAVEDVREVPSVRFPFQRCRVTILYGSLLRVIVERNR